MLCGIFAHQLDVPLYGLGRIGCGSCWKRKDCFKYEDRLVLKILYIIKRNSEENSVSDNGEECYNVGSVEKLEKSVIKPKYMSDYR